MKEDEKFIGLIDSLGLNEDNLTDTQKKGIKIISKRAFPIGE